MNKHVYILFLSLNIFAFLHSPVQAQLCGGGTFTFQIYTVNGRELKNINYEVLPVNIDSINSIFHTAHFDLYQGEILSGIYALKVIDTSGEKELKRQLAFRDNKKQGAIIDGSLTFKTLETANHPYILHLSANKKDVYILANIIGGCNRTTAVLWKEFPQLVSTY